MSKPVERTASRPQWSLFSEVPLSERDGSLKACRELTDSVYEGLDLGGEIRAVVTQNLGDTSLLWDDARLEGLAVCHCGPGTEAGSGTCYVKFGAVRPSPTAERNFDRLLDACEEMAAEKGLSRLAAGVNGPSRSLSPDAGAWLPHGLSGRGHAQAQRARLQPAWCLRDG